MHSLIFGARSRTCGDSRELVAFAKTDRPCPPRKAALRFDQRIEHRLQIERRAADDLEHVGGGRLLLQRFVSSVALHLSSSRAFSMAMTAWSAKFLTNSICLSVNGRTSGRDRADGADQLAVLEQRHAEKGADMANFTAGRSACRRPPAGPRYGPVLGPDRPVRWLSQARLRILPRSCQVLDERGWSIMVNSG